MRRRDFLAGICASTAALAGGGAQAAIQPRVLRLGFINPRDSQVGAGAAEFGRLTEQNCGGRVRVELYPFGALGGELEMTQDISAGTLDMAFTSSATFATIAPELSIFDIPFLFRNVAHARAVLDGEIGKSALALMKAKGIVGLAWGENGLRHVTTTGKPVRSPADLKGVKIRVPQSDVMVTGFKAFGADAQPLPFLDLYPALATGKFQAEENPIAVITSSNLDRVQHYLCLTGHVYSPEAFLISKRSLDRLTPEDQQAVRAAAAAGAKISREVSERSEQNGIDELRQRGMIIVQDVDRPAFVAALAGTEAEYEKKFGKDKIDAIRSFGK